MEREKKKSEKAKWQNAHTGEHNVSSRPKICWSPLKYLQLFSGSENLFLNKGYIFKGSMVESYAVVQWAHWNTAAGR